jgi:cell division protein ZapA (FtsZ GTPase activity inhibitor)
LDSENNEISIKVSIGDRQYPLKIAASEEEFVRGAARLINDKAKFYHDNFSVKDKQDSLAMAALEFASEMLSLKTTMEKQDHHLTQKLAHFQHLITSANN